MPVPMQVTPTQLPEGFCPTSQQDQLNAYAAHLLVTFPLNLGTFSYGNSIPDPDMQGFPWLRLNSDGSPDRWYVYFNGSWVWPNPVAALDVAAVRFHPGPYGSIATYDGGDTGTLGPASGPMWQVVGQTEDISTDYGTYGGRMLIGASADFAAGATGGEINHSLTVAEMPPHVHPALDPATSFRCGGALTSGGEFSGSGAGNVSTTGSAGGTGDPPVVTAHNNMPPYISGYWISRTGRIYYRA